MQSSGQAFTSEDYRFPQDELFELIEPKYNHARLKFSREMKSLSPWITPGSHLKQSQIFQTLQSAQGRPRLMSNASRQVKYKNVHKQLQVSQFQYKLKNTLVQFRVKSLTKNIQRKSFSPTKYPSLEQIDTKICPESSQKNNSSFTLMLEKTPKIKFLERKMKVKQCPGSMKIRRNSRQSHMEKECDIQRFNKTTYLGRFNKSRDQRLNHAFDQDEDN